MISNGLRMGRSVAVTVLVLAGCAADVGDSRLYTREEARDMNGSSDRGEDICTAMGWYGDGVCDEFCVDPDPDCATCAAVPSCAATEVEHASSSDCPADASCREVTVCGATIWCSNVGCSEPPACFAGEQEYSRWEDCPQDDATCREVTGCGVTIWCSDNATCAGFPSCGADETEHASASECPADASCREVTECHATIWCSSTGPSVCPGTNPAGCVSTGCESGFHCDTRMGTAPSDCTCEAKTASWLCTADVNGGVCVPD